MNCLMYEFYLLEQLAKKGRKEKKTEVATLIYNKIDLRRENN